MATRTGPTMNVRMIDNDNDLHSDSSPEDEHNVTLGDINQSHTINFPIKSTYTKWGPVEAFREIVQNWSFNLSEDQFKVIREERAKGRDLEILYKVPHPRTQEYLGYIRFSGCDGKGTVDISNREATLQPWHLDIGGTSKAADSNQAGAHGEGLKVALLVLQRGQQNHSIRCLTGGFTWHFNFTIGGKLVARLRRIADSKIRQAVENSQQLFKNSQIPCEISPPKDVQFIIGINTMGRDERGSRQSRDPVRLEEFNLWCKAALFLQDVPDDGILRSNRGDLITTPQLCGNLYLKGLLLKESKPLSSASMTGKKLKFGYNFRDGSTNRERQFIGEAVEECRAILNIWDRVLANKPEYVRHLDEILRSFKPEYAEVWAASRTMKSTTAVQLKRHLFSDTKKWYYSANENNKELGRKGVELPNSYWEVLESFGLVRTAKQEQERRFMSAEIAAVPTNEFAEETHRLIRATLQGCKQTNTMSVQFVHAAQLSLGTLYVDDDKLFKINETWLRRDESIKILGLPNYLTETDLLFHTIKRLFADVLDGVPNARFRPDDHHSKNWHKQRDLICAEQRLLEYIQMKKKLSLTPISHTSSRVTLQWNSDFSWGDNASVTVQLHREAFCSRIRERITTGDFTAPIQPCIDANRSGAKIERCHEVTCRMEAGSCNFDQLKAGAKYFAVMFKISDPGCIVLISKPCIAPSTISAPQHPSAAKESTDLTKFLGRALTKLDVLQPREWYEVANGGSRPGVIGLVKEEPDGAEGSRKRQRNNV
ncbi:hypothetical protein G7Z17_g2893 [Cylindrodendrum hubeiense]|uniref:Uncharacterized protein n=1 Tax=Cylindrodendrum hubeiense TaxID=595255 RepID=A0A9P5HJZ1_9HYPO|nr:hypothetical protein G7Z17_g2893 [Cylindrodendrum hubeiense]